MKIPARCNKRNCQTRRNLSMRPERYLDWPKCKVNGCGGKMYVDEYRLRRGAHDRAPLCYDGCMHNVRAWPLDKPHRYDSFGCKHYEDWKLQSAAKASKHSPNFDKMRPEEECPF